MDDKKYDKRASQVPQPLNIFNGTPIPGSQIRSSDQAWSTGPQQVPMDTCWIPGDKKHKG